VQCGARVAQQRLAAKHRGETIADDRAQIRSDEGVTALPARSATLCAVNLYSTSAYAAEARRLLPVTAFAPAPLRLIWLAVHYAVVIVGTLAIAKNWLPWPLKLLTSLGIGASFAGLTFVAHEALHGSIVRHRALRRVIGWLGFLPFAVAPRLWEAWHNRVHHGNTNRPGTDPDAYPTLAEYRESRAVQRVTDWLAPGRSRLAGVFSLLVGFSVQSLHMLLAASQRRYLSKGQHRLALLETGAALACWVSVALAVGPATFALVFGLPLIIANSIIMSLILTNHSLSPHTEVNDPLINSLSVSGPRILEWVTLGFGYHVEHHLFPAMSARHAPALREIVRRLWPDRYQGMPYFRALLLLHRSPRVYQSDAMLTDPHKGDSWPTLGASTDAGTVTQPRTQTLAPGTSARETRVPAQGDAKALAAAR